MHRALELPDILHIICEHLIVTSNGEFLTNRDQAQFLQLALTCKTFLPVALDNLWCSMYFITPLLRLMPTFGTKHPDSLEYVLHANPSQDIWDIFDSYAARIRCIHLTARDRIDPSVYDALLSWHPAPLLPNLRRLYWRGLDLSATEAALFVSPTVQRLRFMLFQYPEQDGGTLKFLKQMPETSLEELALWGKLTPACLAVPPRFTNLRTLYVWESYGKSEEAVFDELYTAALKMKHLTSLSLRLPLGYAYASTEPLVLGDLEYLCLQGEIHALTQVFRAMSANQLWELGMTVDTHRCPEGDYSNLLSTLPFPNLHVLEVNTTNEDRNTLTHDHADIIEPLLSLKQLEEVQINFPSDNVRLNDGSIESMANAWPRLKLLRMVTYSSLMSHMHPDVAMIPRLGALVHLARRCPDLQTLQIQVNAREFPDALQPRVSHGLRTMELHCSPIREPQQVALWMDSVFPNITDWRQVDGFWKEEWTTVSNLLHSYRAARTIDRGQRPRSPTSSSCASVDPGRVHDYDSPIQFHE
ncbi:hypothetical protein OE88DRAFT_67767 [Heliocybe sulcata]|uniref:F-box domain-containing protein n=1 Tax=Heliocybe sulcata TaxID=5364 RepID=A0A5C3NHW4_9AGAM|nr:hypothetical protein OE88DRAFT_67767 [Heliocybe sulcata]